MLMKQIISAISIFILVLPENSFSAKPIKVGFWNVENLFDLEDDPTINDDEYALGGRKNVTKEIYNLKLKQLSEVLDKMQADVLGLCEVENRYVLEELNQVTKTNYSIVHYDSPDKRGCSPQGFVALICPISGVVLSSFILSNQTIPGSPFNHAPSIIIEKISLALTYSPSFFGVTITNYICLNISNVYSKTYRVTRH